jgi:GMP synthase-like glutamine amidotransferase
MSTIHLAVFQHTAEEPMGYFETICRNRNIPYTVTRFFDADEIRIADATHLLVLGGPMSVNDEHEFPFLVLEKEIIRSWILAKKPLLGVCLGAQLIASAFGSSVYPCVRESGWHKIQSTRQGIEFGFPQEFFAFQMHGETFDIPAMGEIPCTGDLVRNQGVVLGSALGLQFHPEMTRDLIGNWTQDLPEREIIRISQDTEMHLASSHSVCRTVAGNFFGGVHMAYGIRGRLQK